MDPYDSQLENVANRLKLLPRKLSEQNVRTLGNLYHFETFEEDEITKSSSAKSLSLSGSIVVIDLDFTSANEIEKAKISLSNETASAPSYSPMSQINDPSGHLLAALREPRLDAFAKMLSFLSRCDRFSTKNVDCFRSLDLISECIHQYVNATKSTEFGELRINAQHRLGLGFVYNQLYGGDAYAHLDIVPGSRSEYALRSFTKVEDWLDTTTNKWKTDLDAPECEARAELVLTLDPPVVMDADLANEMNAVTTDKTPQLEERRRSASFSVRRHPRYASADSPHDDFDVLVGNMLPFRLVEVAQIPVSGPAHIPAVLSRLRQFSTFQSLVNSVLQGPEAVWTNEASELNIADALELKDQPVHRKRISLSVALRYVGQCLAIDVSWVISELQLSIRLGGDGQQPEVKFTPKPSAHLNYGDIQRLINKGNLALTVSYALSNFGKLRRRSTATSSS